jgi:hypothetical protein
VGAQEAREPRGTIPSTAAAGPFMAAIRDLRPPDVVDRDRSLCIADYTASLQEPEAIVEEPELNLEIEERDLERREVCTGSSAPRASRCGASLDSLTDPCFTGAEESVGGDQHRCVGEVVGGAHRRRMIARIELHTAITTVD